MASSVAAIILGAGFGGAVLTGLTASQALAACTETPSGSGAYICSGTNAITTFQNLKINKTTDLSVTLNAETPVNPTSDTLAFDLHNSGAGGIVFTQSAAGQSLTARRGVIRAHNWGGGAISITVTGNLTANQGNGIRAAQMNHSNSGGSITISAAGDVTASVVGIWAVADKGTGSVSISAAGVVTGGTREAIMGTTSASGGALTITAATAMGVTYGVRAIGLGTGAVAVTLSGPATSSRRDTSRSEDSAAVFVQGGANATGVNVAIASATGSEGLRVTHAGSGELTVSASGDVTGAEEHGVLVKRTSVGSANISLSGSVTGAGTAASVETQVLSGNAANVTLGSGARVGGVAAQTALLDTVGNASVTVNTGATVVGKIILGAGADTLAFVGGTFSEVTEMQGGGGSDTLKFSGGSTSGSLHATVQSQGLKGWESVVIESGAAIGGTVRLAADSGNLTLDNADIGVVGTLAGGAGTANTLALNNLSGSLNGANLTGWETVSIGAGSSITFGTATHGLTAGSLDVAGTLDVGADSDITDQLTVTGNFDGDDGTVVLNANFADGGSDKLIITGNVTGSANVVLAGLGTLAPGEGPRDRPARIDGVITVQGNVSAGAFSAASVHFGIVAYQLSFDDQNDEFDLVRLGGSSCTESAQGSGVFTCSGAETFQLDQTLSASGTTNLAVTLNSETPVNTTGTAFSLTQTGDGSIQFTQSASTIAEIVGGAGVIEATNSGGGDINISANSTLKTTAAGATAVKAVNEDSSGGAVVISVGSVNVTGNSGHAIEVKNDGAGKTDITATGHVDGGGDGIKFTGDENSNANTSLNIAVATVTGKSAGMRIDHKGAGDVSIVATGAVTSNNTATSGPGVNDPAISLVNRNGASSVTLSVATVTASATRGEAIEVEQHASGAVTITATGPITRSGNDNAHTVRLVRKSTGTASLTFTGAITADHRGDAINIEDAEGDANAAAASLFISVADATGSWAGLRIKHRKGGDVTIIATGAVTSKGGGDEAISLINDDHASNLRITAATVTAQGNQNGDGGATGIYVNQQHGGTVEINAGGPVTTSGGHGIFVKQGGGDAVTINVTGVVTGDDDDNESAIKVAAGGNDAVTINLNGGAVVGSANEDAVVETDGNATVSVKSNAEVKGAIKLGGGSDRVILAGGTARGSIDFGAGADTLEITASGAFSIPTLSGLETLELGTNADVSSAVALSENGSAVGVTLAAGTDVAVTTGTAFTLTQTGAGGITFTQAPSGQTLSGQNGVISATNSGAGNISITATGELSKTGSAGNTLNAVNEDSTGGDIVISVATVTGTTGGGNAIRVKNDGAGKTDITATGHVNGGGDGIRFDGDENNSADTSLTIAVATVTGKFVGMRIDHRGAGDVSVVATGAVTSSNTSTSGPGANDPGIVLTNRNGASSVTLSVATVTASAGGGEAIKVEQRASGPVTISATGAITRSGNGNAHTVLLARKSTGTASLTFTGSITSDHRGDAINIEDAASDANAAAASLFISVADATGSWAGLRIKHRKGGDVTIIATGSVTSKGGGDEAISLVNEDHASNLKITAATVTAQGNQGGDGGATGIYVRQKHGGTVEINAGGPVTTSGGHGIFVKQEGDGAVTINVTGTVTGDDDDNESAIKVAAGPNDAVTINLNGGAVVGSANEDAVVETDGNATVSVKPDAEVKGAIKLGGGNDTLEFSGGTFANSASLDGGAGTDALTFGGGTSGTLAGAVGWETVDIEARSSIAFGTGVHSLTAGTLSVAEGGTLDVGKDTDTGDALTVSGNFDSSSGTVTLNANFVDGSKDTLTITGNVTGTTNVAVTGLGQLGNNQTDDDRPAKIAGVVTVQGTVDANAFAGSVAVGEITYLLRADSTGKIFDLIKIVPSDCRAATGTPGAFVCSGTDTIDVTKSLNATGSAALSVTLNSETGIDASGSAFVLTQTGGTGGISFTQSAGGQAIKGASSAITASNSGGGAISIDVNGTVTGAAGDGISATNGAGGSGISITAVSVSGAESGISAEEGGSGAVSILATGTVTGASEYGIYAKTGDSGGAITVTAATVTGGKAGIRAVGGGDISIAQSGAGEIKATDRGIHAVSSGGSISINVAGTVSQTGTSDKTALYAKNVGSTTGDLTITTGDVSGQEYGIRAVNEGTGAIDITVTGSATQLREYLDRYSALKATNTAQGTGIFVTFKKKPGAGDDAVSINAAKQGIYLSNSGSGATSLTVEGEIAGKVERLAVNVVAAATSQDITVSLRDHARTSAGVRAVHSGTGNVSITVSDLTSTRTNGLFYARSGIYAKTGGNIFIAASGRISNTNRATLASIQAASSAGKIVTVTLNSGARVEGDLLDGAGNASVTVNSGAAALRTIELGAGDDTLVFDGGAFSSATGMNGGTGTDDTLTFRSGTGSLHATVVNDGLKGWEDIVVESGATINGTIKLADDSGDLTFSDHASIASIGTLTGGGGSANTLAFNNVSGSLNGANVTGWEKVSVGTGSSIAFGAGTHGLTAATLSLSGTLDVGKDSDTADALTVTGNFEGGGTVTLNANFLPNAGASDTLTITGNVTGTTNLVVTALTGNLGNNQTNADRPETISDVVTVQGNVAAGAFTSSVVDLGGVAYRLEVGDSGKAFDLVRYFTNACRAASTPGAFTCSGADQIGEAQSLSASGTTALSVTLNSETAIDTTGTAFTLAQTGGAGGISFTQSASGQTIKGASSAIAASNSGRGAILIDVNGAVTGVAGDGISATNDASGEGITITAGSVSGANSGIKAVERGSGAVKIVATGAVTGTGTAGIQVDAGDATGAVTVTAATVTGGANAHGIHVAQTGRGAVSILATGAVTGGSGAHGIYADLGSNSGTVMVTAAAVTGGNRGIYLKGKDGGSDLSVSVSGAVSGGTGDGAYLYAYTGGANAAVESTASVTGATRGLAVTADGAITVNVSGTVHGGTRGLFMKHFQGSELIQATISGSVTSGSGSGGQAIRIESPGGAVTVTLDSGAWIGAKGTAPRTAIHKSGGTANATVTVNTGASVSGKVDLGDGNDTLTFAGGAFSDVTEMQGGAGSDTLRFSGGSGSLHATVRSQGLKGWESIVVESGATVSGNIKLAGDSGNLTLDSATLGSSISLDGGGGSANTLTLNNMSGAINSANVTGWETIGIGARSSITFGTGTHSTSLETLRVSAGGTLDVGHDTDTGDALTVSGDFEGGGTISLNANFLPNAGASDTLTITGDVTGTTNVVVGALAGNLGNNQGDDDRPETIGGVVTVQGTLAAGAFTSSVVEFGAVAYQLRVNENNSKVFDLVRFFTNNCEAVAATPGAFTCSGTNQIGASQPLGASATAALSVRLNSETAVDTDGTAFVLTQTGGAGGISFTQSAAGQAIKGASSAIAASNAGGGAISIDVNGAVTGAAGDGISATNDAAGSGITITAGSVSGADSGIKAVEGGSGAVKITATGTVRGTGTAGVQASGGATATGLTVDVATVTGSAGIDAQHAGTGELKISASGPVTASTGTGVSGLVSGAASLSITATEVTGSAVGIKVVSSGAGAISVEATGTVTGTGTAGVQATGGATTGAMAIDVATVTGRTGIEAEQGSANKLDIAASGEVTGTGAGGVGIDALVSASGALTITAAAVTGSTAGIMAVSSGTGAVSVEATGAVEATDTSGVGIDAATSSGALTITAAAVTGAGTGIKVAATGTGNVAIAVSGSVIGTAGDGIFVKHDGAGATTITVSSAVTGGAGAGVAAIRTDVSSGGATVALNSGASVGAGTSNAIMGSGGSAAVTVNAGATIAGKVDLGGGTDTLTFAGGTFTSVTEMDGGAGSADTLTFSGGSGSLHATVQSEGLKGWESVIVQSGATLSGAIKLADDSGNLTLDDADIANITALTGGAGTGNTLALNNMSETISSATATGWETVRIGAGSTVKFGSGTHTSTSGALSVAAGGTLDVGNDTDTADALTVPGNFAGGGTVTLNVNFDPNAIAKDTLTISGAATGTTTLSIVKIAETSSISDANRPQTIAGVISVAGIVSANAFVARGDVSFGGISYQLKFNAGVGAAASTFDLEKASANECEETSTGSGVFVCSGAGTISVTQSLSASGATALSVTLNSETPVDVGGTAFALTQTGGNGGISFTQSAAGQAIGGTSSAIVADNSSGGAVEINVNGAVSGTAAYGISASDDASGAGITVTAASVSGGKSGIRAVGSGTGAVKIDATGTVTGSSEDGVYAKTGTSGGAITVTAAAVAGGKVGIKVSAGGQAAVSVKTTGAVAGTGTAGIQLVGGARVTDMAIDAAAVSGKTGIDARHGGTGKLDVKATGAVSGGRGGMGIYGLVSNASGGALTITAAAVSGNSAGIKAVSSGSGAVSVTATGAVSANGRSSAGIKVEGRGSGAVNVTATGGVSARSNGGIGVDVDVGANAGPVAVSVGTVNAYTRGVKVVSRSASSATVSLSGRIHTQDPDDYRSWGVEARAEGQGSLTLSIAGQISAEYHGVHAESRGSGALSISARHVIRTNTAVKAIGGTATNGVTVTVGSAYGQIFGVDAQHSGAGDLSITTTGTVTGTRSAAVKAVGSNAVNVKVNAGGELQTGNHPSFVTVAIDALASGSGDITITAASLRSGTAGIRAVSKGAGDVSISVTGPVLGTRSFPLRLRDGIYVEQDGSGDTSISVSGRIQAGTAIKTKVPAGSDVTISLDSGASVVGLGTAPGRGDAIREGFGTAIVGGEGDTTVTVNTGATLAGSVSLGAGADRLTFAGGAFSSATVLDGGAGSDTLRFAKGSGTLSGGNPINWERIEIASGASVAFGSATLTAGTLDVRGTLDVGRDGDATDALTLSGTFAGGNGTVALDTNFADGGTDTLTISGNVTGTTRLDIAQIGELGAGQERPPSIAGVIKVQGSVSAGAFTWAGAAFGDIGYRLKFVAASKTFDLVQSFANECEASGTSGVYTCSGAGRIGETQSLSASGATDLSVTLNAETLVNVVFGIGDAAATAFALSQTGGGGGISFTQSANGREIRGAGGGIAATNSGGGAISISVSGTVAAAGGDGIAASADGGSITVSAAGVTGSATGIKVEATGAGSVSISASGAVTGTGGNGIAASADGGSVTVSAAGVTGSATGIKVEATGAGSVSISASGAVTGTGGDGIFVDHDGSGATNITVTASVAGGTGAGNAAIRTDVSSGATVTLGSGASVGTGTSNAITGSGGNTAVTVNTGATVTGRVSLGGGTDMLTFAGGTFTSVTEMDGGAGPGDTLRFSGGSGSLNDAIAGSSGVGLKGWESIVVESGATLSGAIKLADDSGNLTLNGAALGSLTSLDGGGGSANTLTLNNMSGSISGANVVGWETIGIGARSSITFGTGAHSTTQETLRVSAGGTLDVGNDTDTDDHLTVSGDFAGGGTIALNANFLPAAGASDKLTITGDVTGTTNVVFAALAGNLRGNQTDTDRPQTITGVITVTGAVSGNAFVAAGDVVFGAIGYRLSFNGGTFDLVKYFTNSCEAVPGTPGAFTCEGRNQIGASQSLGASGSAALAVTLDALTAADTGGTAFVLTQTGGTGGIAFTQSANGASVKGVESGIGAVNSGGGAISISVNGTVTGAVKYGISAVNDDLGGDISIAAAAVVGGAAGIRAISSGTGAVSIETAGRVSATGAAGIGIIASATGGDVTVTAAAVAGAATGIRVSATGTGGVSVFASGAVTGTGSDGIFVKHDGSGATTITADAAVAGGAGNGAAIRTDVSSGAAIVLRSGASVGSGARNAIVGSGGNTAVTVNAGAAIAGRVSLGGGTDTLTFAGGSFSNVTEMDGGDGTGDTLTFSGGSGSLNATVRSEGLKGWERIIVQSGATLSGVIKLAASSDRLTLDGTDVSGIGTLTGGGGRASALSLDNVSGSLSGANVTGWETVRIGANSSITLGTGSHSLDAGTLSVAPGATLAVGNNAASDDHLTVSGDFAGGGSVILDADFTGNGSGGDRLTIEGDAAGATTVDFIPINETGFVVDNDRPGRITGVIKVDGAVSANAFIAGGDITFGAYGYALEFNDSGKRFDLVRFLANTCEPVSGSSGAFSCSGSQQIGTTQSLGTQGSIALTVTLGAGTEVRTRGTGSAFTMTQSGAAGITFRQEARGGGITAGRDGFSAVNAGGGSVAIAATGTITAGRDGVAVSNGPGGADARVTVATVDAGGDGVRVRSNGSGGVAVTATGSVSAGRDGVSAVGGAGGSGVNVTVATVSATLGDGVSVYGGGGAVAVAAGSVQGGDAGIRVRTGGRGTGVAVSAGAVEGGKSSGISVEHGGGGSVRISALDSVTGAENGIYVRGGDRLEVTASGAVLGRRGDGIHAGSDASAQISVSVSAEVTGGLVAGKAAIRTDSADGTAAVVLESGASVRANASGKAIMDGRGAATVTLRSGASILGGVSLGAGADELVLAGGDFSGITSIDGGPGYDTLRITAGSGSLAALSGGGAGTSGIESVVVSGLARLSGDVAVSEGTAELVFADGADIGGDAKLTGAGDARLVFRGVSGELDISRLSNWSAVEIGGGSRVSLSGARLGDAAADSLSVAGTMAFGSDGSAGDSFTVEGDLSGGGGRVEIDANLAAGSTDRLVIEGDVSGTTSIALNNITPSGGRHSSDEMEVVAVRGRADASAFRLEGDAIPAGAFIYDLQHVPDGGRFVLRPGDRVSDTGAALRSAPAAIAGGFAAAAALSARTAARAPTAAVGAGIGSAATLGERGSAIVGQGAVNMAAAEARSVWMRFYGDRREFGADAVGGAAEIDSNGFQFGIDVFAREAAAGKWIAGLTAQYGTVKAETQGGGGAGRQESSGQSVGATLSWLGYSGFYADAQAQFGAVDSDYSSDTMGVLGSGVSSETSLLALEAGWRIAVGGRATLVPQGQIGMSGVKSDGFTSGSLHVESGTATSIDGRVGLAAEFAVPGGGVRISGNLLRTLSEPDGTVVNGRTVERGGPDGWAEFGAGGSFDLNDDTVLFLDGTWRTGIGDGDASGASISGGLKLNW